MSRYLNEKTQKDTHHTSYATESGGSGILPHHGILGGLRHLTGTTQHGVHTQCKVENGEDNKEGNRLAKVIANHLSRLAVRPNELFLGTCRSTHK